jgi:mono/diheme cytochrome c family protein
MRWRALWIKAICGIVAALGAGVLAAWLAMGRPSASAPAASSWNPRAAAAYLDRRAGWWIAWPDADRDHETHCISCHTVLPYVLARPALGEKEPSASERTLLAGVIKRVRLWREVKPFYTDSAGAGKSSQSRGTESILNALILASTDARNGKLSDDTRRV